MSNKRPSTASFAYRACLGALTLGIIALLGTSLLTGLPEQDRIAQILGDRPLSTAQLQRLDEQRARELPGMLRNKTLGEATYHPSAPRADGQDAFFSEDQKLVALRAFTLQAPNGDEGAPYTALSRIRPRELEFDPRFYNYGGAFLYPLGVLIFSLDLIGIVSARPNVSHYVLHPDKITEIYLVGRALNVGFFLGSLILLFKLVRLLSSRRDAVVAAAAFAAAPIVWMSTLSARPHMAAAFWSTLMLYCVVRFVSEEKFRYFVLAAIALGLAAGSSLPAAIVGLAFPLLLYGAKPLRFAIGYSATAALAALVVFVLTNPYAVLNFGEFFDNISFHADSDRYQRVAFDVGKAVAFFIDVVYDFSFPMSLVGLLAIAWFVVDPPSKLGRRIALLAGAVLVLVGSTIATTRILIFIVPIVAVVAALAIGRLLSVAKAPAVRAALVVPLMVPSSITALVFSVDSLAEAQDHERFLQWSEKARKHPEQAVGLLSSPTPHYFPPFPFFHREVVDLSRVASDTSRLPRFAVVSEPDEPLWETYPSRKYYRQVLVSQRPLWPEWLRISGIDPRRDHRRPKRVSVFEATSVR